MAEAKLALSLDDLISKNKEPRSIKGVRVTGSRKGLVRAPQRAVGGSGPSNGAAVQSAAIKPAGGRGGKANARVAPLALTKTGIAKSRGSSNRKGAQRDRPRAAGGAAASFLDRQAPAAPYMVQQQQQPRMVSA